MYITSCLQEYGFVDEWETVRLVKLLGRGAFGAVYLGYVKDEHDKWKPVAVKKIRGITYSNMIRLFYIHKEQKDSC